MGTFSGMPPGKGRSVGACTRSARCAGTVSRASLISVAEGRPREQEMKERVVQPQSAAGTRSRLAGQFRWQVGPEDGLALQARPSLKAP